MFIGNQKQNDEFHSLILQTIRDIGVKHRLKKTHFNKNIQDSRVITKDSKVFRRHLFALDTELVSLKSGIAVEVPSFVVETCCHIKQRCDIEGIFRKAGSAARLREIKAIIDNGKHLESHHHVIDVSNILKLFFRELPEPLLPYLFHDLLLRCLLVKDKATEGILLTCLLFPSIHLNTLVYLMEFFRDVADSEESNKMGITNLAIIITPSLMPVEKNINCGTRLEHHVRVIETLLHNSERIGFVPEFIAEKALNNGCVVTAHEETENFENDESKTKKKKKKRRSGSLTRMINGLKKMVGKGSPEVNDCPITSTSDCSSPCVKSAKKRKLHESSGAFSSKKKRDILRSLPQSVALANAPCTPLPAAIGELHYTPKIHSHPNPCGKSDSPRHRQKPKKFFSFSHHSERTNNSAATKSESLLKTHLSVRKSGKKSKKAVNASVGETDTSSRSDKERRPSLDWQWKHGSRKQKKCLSSSDTPLYTADLIGDSKSSDSMFCSESMSHTSVFDVGIDLSSSGVSSDTEFVKIPKSEYEDIKNRVSAIENRISQEFGSIASDALQDIRDIPLIDDSEDDSCSAKKVQNAYEKTLEESEKLGDPITTDQLAKRLSKELKIRHSLENKVIRSPSARKIGTIRRRSRENARTSLDKRSKSNSPKHVSRQASMEQNRDQVVNQQVFYAKSSLRRGRPNTVYSGLPQPSPRIPVVVSAESLNMDFANDQESVKVNKEQNPAAPINKCNVSCEDSTEILSSHVTIENVPVENTPDRCEVRRASSFHGTNHLCDRDFCDIKKSVSQGDVACSSTNYGKQFPLNRSVDPKINEHWENAPQFFRRKEIQTIPVSGRESVVKIRNQNAGMVLARMRLFDKKQGSGRTPSHVAYFPLGNEEKSLSVMHNTAQSLRIKCMQDNFLEKLNSQSGPGDRRRSVRLNSLPYSPTASLAFKSSPKKIGSPRKKYQRQKSPKVEVLNRSPFAAKSNITAAPTVLNCGKENISSTASFGVTPLSKVNIENNSIKSEVLQQIHLPENLKETIYDVCTPKTEKLNKMSVSPLKDCNRIDVNSSVPFVSEGIRMNILKTPRSAPYIKKPLLVKSPSDFVHTPYCRTPAFDSRSHRSATPMKALPNITPVVSYKQSPSTHSKRPRSVVK